jgi:hypothetical protein
MSSSHITISNTMDFSHSRNLNLKKLNLIAAAMIFAGATAFAGTGHYTATLAQPLTASKIFIANGSIWRCNVSTCVLTSAPTDADSLHTCHALARQAGTLTAYGNETNPFNTEKLANCNH